ncbi:MAG: helix-turn-helix domain-containing protein [Clostridia bacterium]|nr:helix-turn-helix domain-containing protein [Clostridia bacterium]
MPFAAELRFVLDVFSKSNIAAAVLSAGEPISRIYGDGYAPFFRRALRGDACLAAYFGATETETVYKVRDPFFLRYLYFLLPGGGQQVYFVLGPYLQEPLSREQLLELGEKNGIPPQEQNYFEKYMSGIPVLPESSHLFSMLDTFCERLFGGPFGVRDITREQEEPATPLLPADSAAGPEGALANMQMMEKRYSYENELIRAVATGQMQKLTPLLSAFSSMAFESRTSDALRNMKNYAIITNTLLRKAAESGGVHPLYLDSVSSAFAVRIEQIQVLSEVSPLMGEMFNSYCRLVRKNAYKDASPIVKKTILTIDFDLSANLTLSSLAALHKVSAGYLSTAFKRETGKSLTTYITEKRMKHAAYLLSTTSLQIQTVALHCGFVDLQYFSKTFKRYMGKTPKQYRETAR